MAQIDTAKIEGYAEMTNEEKIAALEGYTYDDNAAELERQKTAISRANAEAAEWKRKFNAQLSEEERKAQEQEDERAALLSRVAELERKDKISGFVAQFLALGYSAELASDTATAMADGDTEKIFLNQKAFLDSHDKAYKAQLLKETPTPPAGNGTEGMTIEKFRKLPPDERLKWSQEHPEEYKNLYGGNT